MSEALHLIITCLSVIATFILGGYGVLLLGRLLHANLIAKRRLFWTVYLTGAVGIALLLLHFFVHDDGNWFLWLGVMFMVLAFVTMVNYKGQKSR